MDDRQRLRRAGQGDVELAQARGAAFFLDQGRLDDDDVLKLEALRLARGQPRGGEPSATARPRRRPPEEPPRGRAQEASGPPYKGIPGKPTSTSAKPTRDGMATPFHWFRP